MKLQGPDAPRGKKILSFHGKTQRDINGDPKSADWKVMIAHFLKRHTAVTNAWLSRHLNMGVTAGVSRYIYIFEYKHKGRAYKRMIARISPLALSSLENDISASKGAAP
ncbi:hypothetical protein ACFL3F_02020 [Planctomycetota bacterium]